jgi:hypothetical protein
MSGGCNHALSTRYCVWHIGSDFVFWFHVDLIFRREHVVGLKERSNLGPPVPRVSITNRHACRLQRITHARHLNSLRMIATCSQAARPPWNATQTSRKPWDERANGKCGNRRAGVSYWLSATTSLSASNPVISPIRESSDEFACKLAVEDTIYFYYYHENK